mmetsp:Transcript_19450/g.42294  ORF Transcript_19450/g.42294 Transcript_19450/m.42294 type:complete len:820 (-) Transcript_19450:205-2664(-)|eukprot:CAMPEP_0172303552 /NCGR_PEP_ID=MMETSP1058-20130122/5080_1 /TAXON_ID=83371 /ORGANISM="Detonula confervacea, Strain CCMP 353" /LENGTH=819 /DNA_ID=CAMNT_0013014415 /DNA_START=22 /DNA_END=2478 /DNA_ORIENTATION=+
MTNKATAILLLLSCSSSSLPVSNAARSIAPVALSGDAEQCTTPGSCGAHEDEYDDDDSGDSDDDDEEEDGMNHRFQKHLSHIDPYDHDEIPFPTTMQRHVERTLVASTFPNALPTMLAKAGNYSDGTPAGSSQWVGDEGAQNIESPTYASFGSVLDISSLSSLTWSGGTEFGDAIPWMASLFHRRDIIGEGDSPCRVDLLDDYDVEDDVACYVGASIDNYVTVRGSEQVKNSEMIQAAEYDILDKGEFLAKSVIHFNEETFGGRKFDTIVAKGVLANVDEYVDSTAMPMYDQDLILEKLVGCLKPGGTLYLIGSEPLQEVKGPGGVYKDVMDIFDSVKSLSKVYPKRNLPASWINRNLARQGLNVHTSTLFPTYHSYEDMTTTISEVYDWLSGLPDTVPGAVKKTYGEMLDKLEARVEEVTANGPVFAGEHDYIIAAQLPLSSSAKEKSILPMVDTPTMYEPKTHYKKDINPKVEELDTSPIGPGTMLEHRWANGDTYDGFSARIGIPDKLVSVLTEYVKDLGLWDLMIDTVYNKPMEPDSTRFYEFTSPYGNGERNFTWSAKRPDNFKGSDSDMHWFDIGDEAAHEDSLRALAKGGFDEVLNTIGTYLGSKQLVSFSIGLLAVTKAGKGHVHVDFQQSKRRAFNFLVNLETPGDEPELTVVEEDCLGNRRRGQVKYAPTFGVLNGDDGMHATNECNHRASKGVRITASIFISELEEESLDQVADHDNYYFPFGNMDWIWAQRGRHWSKDGSVSLVSDKGRVPFEAKDDLEGCEERVGEKKEKCVQNTIERKRCYKTCGTFVTDDKYRPGEERQKVFGW